MTSAVAAVQPPSLRRAVLSTAPPKRGGRCRCRRARRRADIASTDCRQRGTGALQRPPDSGYRGADYDFITVETQGGQGRDGIDLLHARHQAGAQRGARAVSRKARLLRELVTTASTDQNRDQQIGRTLFNLLIPVELEAFLAGSGEMQIELDPATAGIPWELLDTKGDDRRRAPLGDPRQPAPQAAYPATSASKSSTPTPTPARW